MQGEDKTNVWLKELNDLEGELESIVAKILSHTSSNGLRREYLVPGYSSVTLIVDAKD